MSGHATDPDGLFPAHRGTYKGRGPSDMPHSQPQLRQSLLYAVASTDRRANAFVPGLASARLSPIAPTQRARRTVRDTAETLASCAGVAKNLADFGGKGNTDVSIVTIDRTGPSSMAVVSGMRSCVAHRMAGEHARRVPVAPARPALSLCRGFQVADAASLSHVCRATDAWRSGFVAKERDEVMRLATEQSRGVGHTAADRAQMEAAIDALIAAAPPPEKANTSHQRLTATWRVIWTSERETLFLLSKWPGPGKTKATTTQAYQRIDVNAGTLNNAVVFVSGNVFEVDSTIEVADLDDVENARVNFAFDAARLALRRPLEVTVPLPPVGKGWFDNLYVDDTLRIARDSRGDTLVVVRDEHAR